MKKKQIISRIIRNRMILLISLLFIIIGITTTIIVFSQVKNGLREGIIYKAKTDLTLGYQYLDLKYPGDWRQFNNNLYKGNMLINDNIKLINDIAHHTGGTVTIFHHGKRVATNVMTKDGIRATGTEVSPTVAEEVLHKGGIYLGEANVVGHFYQTAYMPIKNSKKQIIGMWYVGVSENYIDENFSLLVKDILFLFFTVLVAVTLVSIYVASRFYVPIRNIEIVNEMIKIKNKELERAYETMEQLANTDSLTGLLNRRAMLERMQEEGSRFSRNKKEFVLVMLDIDDFKKINDNYGHDCGDYVLKAVSCLIGAIIRRQDSFSRWGGEEFLLMITETAIKDAQMVGEKIRHSIEKEKFRYNKLAFNVTLTLGIAEYSSGIDIEKCIRHADEALYRGKREGKNRVTLHTSDAP